MLLQCFVTVRLRWAEPLQGFVPLRAAVPFQKLNVDAFAWYGARASAIARVCAFAGGAGGNTVTGSTLRWIPFASQLCTKSVTNRSNRQCGISIAGQCHVEELTMLEIKLISAQLIRAVRASNPASCLFLSALLSHFTGRCHGICHLFHLFFQRSLLCRKAPLGK
jgi:hypothetical protein